MCYNLHISLHMKLTNNYNNLTNKLHESNEYVKG